MNVNTPSIAAAGLAAGSATCQNARHRLQPSIRAASTSSSGMASSRYCRIQNTPNAVTRFGTITASSSPAQPNSAIAMYSGMIPNWVGTASVATTNRNSTPRPRNRNLANANPASVDSRTTDSVTVPETMKLLPSAFQNGMVSNTRLALVQKLT